MYDVGDRVVWNGYRARIWSVEDRRVNGGTITYGIIHGRVNGGTITYGSTWVQESDISMLEGD